MVQTAFLANAINVSLEDDAKARRDELSATDALYFMEEAIQASERIPLEMSAADAAQDFAGWMLKSHRDAGDAVPMWFARH